MTNIHFSPRCREPHLEGLIPYWVTWFCPCSHSGCLRGAGDFGMYRRLSLPICRMSAYKLWKHGSWMHVGTASLSQFYRVPAIYVLEQKKNKIENVYPCKQQQIPGLLLSIDFQQAFDSISWKFIHKVLDYFNFGPSIRSWIKLFQSGAESCILQNGFMSDFFQFGRGCRQGDPISPYIFILCVEVLGIMIRKSEGVKGIKINNVEFKLSQYADDTQMF